MKIIAAIAVFALSIGFAAHTHAQSPHPITWTPVTASPGARVVIAGNAFTLVRSPVRDLGGARRFQLSFLAPRTGTSVVGFVTTLHSTAPLTDPIQIDGFDANLTISDGRNYTVMSNFASPATTDFTLTVTAQATCTVNIKVGQTLIMLFATLSTVQQPETDIGNIPNGVPLAEFADYIHPTAQVNGCNRWVDYVRIQEI